MLPAAAAFSALALAAVSALPGVLLPPSSEAAAPTPGVATTVGAQAFVASDLPDSIVIRDNFSAAAAPARIVEITAQNSAAAAEDETATDDDTGAASETGSTGAEIGSSAVRWPFPVGVRVSDDYGPRTAPCDGCSTFHKGLDMTPGAGTPISSVADGIVRETGETDTGFGNYAVIDHVVGGELVSTLYAHMQWGSLAVSEGQPVKAGQRLGAVGSTGQSTGPHLHLEVWENGTDPIDPYAWLTRHAA
ncbi:M23 family metallopeptidase [Rathayibacter tanaceti]|uniref:Murein DD-endopeptidase MepM n=2 Tax=Rathayibacter tanaceti TaxID=1671680 RepID=A0A166HJP4_9MICO|nr:M23 family metallopeptidase [Rathayibacter tanaceti]KZX20716.1 Murein DD-endopeptidase MepM [Rathayibacter tanaceti]QHC54977.1 peptidoglycan DD-metalloendopeptidase family protein [Rathayibacter tanaceti]TCO38522.1 murein DD-endopeptidase MepM/ murein hydrolase activator NlpD [Rathayibacter tanaceti]